MCHGHIKDTDFATTFFWLKTLPLMIDIKATGVWEKNFSYFFNIKVFHPLAKSCPTNLTDAYKY